MGRHAACFSAGFWTTARTEAGGETVFVVGDV